MITLDDLKEASEKLDKMYREEVYPKVLAFRAAWDKLTAPFLADSMRDVAKRHDIEFLPNHEFAKNIYVLCGIARTHMTVTSKCLDSYTGLYRYTFAVNSSHRGEEACPTMVEVTGHNNCFGFWDGTLWSVIRGNSWLRDSSHMNDIQKFLVQWRKNLLTVLEQFNWFSENIGTIAKQLEDKVNAIVKLDAKDTDEFHALFDIKPKAKMVKITVVVEEV